MLELDTDEVGFFIFSTIVFSLLLLVPPLLLNDFVDFLLVVAVLDGTFTGVDGDDNLSKSIVFLLRTKLCFLLFFRREISYKSSSSRRSLSSSSSPSSAFPFSCSSNVFLGVVLVMSSVLEST